MIEKLKLEIPVLLPQNEDCAECVERLQEALHLRKGIEEAHVDQTSEPARLCLHYDPNMITLAQVEREARQEGIAVSQRYRHRQLQVEGMDCAECALKLEKGVSRLDGVLHTAVDFASSTMMVEYDVDQVEQSDIAQRVRRLGYDVREPEAAAIPEAGPGGLRGLWSFVKNRRRDLLTMTAGVLIALARPLVDYQFFQLLTQRIDEAEQGGDSQGASRFKALRKDILELTQQLDAETREQMLAKAQLLTEIVQSQDRRAAIRMHLQEIDSSFLSVLEANIAQSQQQGQDQVAEQLRAVRAEISDVLQENAPPEFRLINRLLQAEYPDETRQMLRDNQSSVNAEFIAMLGTLAQDLAERGQQETSEQLKQLKAQAELLS